MANVKFHLYGEGQSRSIILVIENNIHITRFARIVEHSIHLNMHIYYLNESEEEIRNVFANTNSTQTSGAVQLVCDTIKKLKMSLTNFDWIISNNYCIFMPHSFIVNWFALCSNGMCGECGLAQLARMRSTHSFVCTLLLNQLNFLTISNQFSSMYTRAGAIMHSKCKINKFTYRPLHNTNLIAFILFIFK